MISAGVSSSNSTTASTHVERREHFRTLRLGIDRPAGALVPRTDASRVEADDQRVAERARALQVADVPGMQQIEHAVGEDDRAARRPEVLDQATAAPATARVDAAVFHLHGLTRPSART